MQTRPLKLLSILLLASALTFGCSSLIQQPYPLAGWTVDVNHDPTAEISDDYHAYINALPPKQREKAWPVLYLKDGNGQHAIMFRIGINGTWWEHILIYDKDNKRIKAIKYRAGEYMS